MELQKIANDPLATRYACCGPLKTLTVVTSGCRSANSKHPWNRPSHSDLPYHWPRHPVQRQRPEALLPLPEPTSSGGAGNQRRSGGARPLAAVCAPARFSLLNPMWRDLPTP